MNIKTISSFALMYIAPKSFQLWVFKHYQSDISRSFHLGVIEKRYFENSSQRSMLIYWQFKRLFRKLRTILISFWKIMKAFVIENRILPRYVLEKRSLIPLTIRQRDRSIVAILQDGDRIIAFTSCHLVGQQPKRRFQQVFAICQQLKKETQRYDIDLFVIAGDFNATGNQTPQEILTCGVVEQDLEDKHPLEEITSNRKEQNIGKFTDIHASTGNSPTMEVLNARDRIIDWENKNTTELYSSIKIIFDQSSEEER